nr:MAG TPA: hypothetical protein [Caudoviricetes sp.]
MNVAKKDKERFNMSKEFLEIIKFLDEANKKIKSNKKKKK